MMTLTALDAANMSWHARARRHHAQTITRIATGRQDAYERDLIALLDALRFSRDWRTIAALAGSVYTNELAHPIERAAAGRLIRAAAGQVTR